MPYAAAPEGRHPGRLSPKYGDPNLHFAGTQDMNKRKSIWLGSAWMSTAMTIAITVA